MNYFAKVYIVFTCNKGGFFAMITEALKSRIYKMQEDLDRITGIREDITSEDILKMSMELDDLIVEYTKTVNMIN